MAISVVNSSNAIQGTSASSVTSSPFFTSTSGNLLIAGCISWGAAGEGATPITDGGTNTFSPPAKSTNIGSGPTFADLFFAKNCTGKAGEAVIYSIASAQFPAVCLIEASGCDTTAPNDFAVSYTSASPGGSTLASTLVTPAAGDHLMVVVGTTGGAPTQTITNAGTGSATWTVIKNDNSSNQPVLLAYSIVTANGTDTYGVTYGGLGGDNIVGIAAFKAAAGGAAAPVRPPQRNMRGAG